MADSGFRLNNQLHSSLTDGPSAAQAAHISDTTSINDGCGQSNAAQGQPITSHK